MAEASPDNTATAGDEDGYWAQSRQPLASLVFIAPLLVIYEVGIILLGPMAMRNGAEVWLRMMLDQIGFGQYFLLPILTVGTLLAWHHTTHHPWRLARGVFSGMFVESVLLAICLWVLLQIQGTLCNFASGVTTEIPIRSGFASSMFAAVRTGVGYLGAGIYEELLFRLLLLPFVVWILQQLRASRPTALVLAIVLTSLLFSGAHYIGPSGEHLRWFSFVFRFIAGAFFATLFVSRGFGIAVGTHAGYDIVIGLLHGGG
jgi:hypothetical protein